MDNISKQILDKFEIKCKKCGSTEIKLSIDIAFAEDEGFVPGLIVVECKTCKDNKVIESL